MYNDFVIIGPAADPAGVKGMTVAAALGKIAADNAVFVSRGDNSGTHKMEKSLWKQIEGPSPEKEAWYVQTGQGMLRTINVAAEKGGYTMTDRGTYIKYEASMDGNPPLKILVEGDKILFNQYSAIPVNPAHCPKVKKDLADKFVNWMASPATQKTIGDFKLMGKALFTPQRRIIPSGPIYAGQPSGHRQRGDPFAPLSLQVSIRQYRPPAAYFLRLAPKSYGSHA